ncbi:MULTISPECIES: hypothetical protein [Rhizobium]|uniref:hypothetical protein n=1 Tax=Rhizobium TaxID=379 RepID=UPI001B330FAF|nr:MULTISPECIES: hypothetical protein [Rhizobium]MBX4906926.1 hypothetical protein [Rhizobium bangladeshense]MBX5234164.1 hypothetical protein [Rhizobium sp. NLR4a]MBX5253977.1 hypothetical protein [Rhizobium sp. NLR4b]MBX5255983.1 hypothetical protein [Rhizobium sp. NLR16b]MBX5262078.1 hypothetical protein [Rhizobium sp. NLR16a]
MDATTLSERLFGLSFLMLWVLPAILIFSGVRHGLNAEPKDDDRSRAQARSHGRIVRHLLEGDRRNRAVTQAVEAKARSYFVRRTGKIHLAALAFFIVTTLFLALWNRHEAKMQRASQIQVTSPLQHDK